MRKKSTSASKASTELTPDSCRGSVEIPLLLKETIKRIDLVRLGHLDHPRYDVVVFPLAHDRPTRYGDSLMTAICIALHQREAARGRKTLPHAGQV